MWRTTGVRGSWSAGLAAIVSVADISVTDILPSCCLSFKPFRHSITVETRKQHLTGAALFAGFAALYLLSISPDAVNIGRYNFVFDADPARVVRDALEGQ